jgi:outer membrane lipoprotein
MRTLLLPLALTLALGACATTPSQLQGQYSTIDPQQAAAQQAPAEAVRWGGRIVEVHTEKLFTCFEIVGAPLDSSGRPREVDDSNGRFLACRDGFYEPEVFKQGRELTISGKIDGYETRKIGEYDYRYPRVAADVVYLWPERVDYDHDHYHGYPGWGWGMGWGWYGGPWGWGPWW